MVGVDIFEDVLSNYSAIHNFSSTCFEHSHREDKNYQFFIIGFVTTIFIVLWVPSYTRDGCEIIECYWKAKSQTVAF